MTVPAPPVSTPPVLGMQNPNYDGPEDFLVLAVITTMGCAVFNVVSIFFVGSFAMISAAMAWKKKEAYNYPSAQRYAMIAVVLSFCNVISTGVVVSGVIIGALIPIFQLPRT